jgi:hypothetical protein
MYGMVWPFSFVLFPQRFSASAVFRAHGLPLQHVPLDLTLSSGAGGTLQVMPWYVVGKMSDYDLQSMNT